MPYGIIGAIGEAILADGFSASNGNKCVLMGLDNDVMFCDDIQVPTYSRGTALMSLPDPSMAPIDDVSFPVLVTQRKRGITAAEFDAGNFDAVSQWAVVTVDSSATVSIDRDLSDCTVCLRGCVFQSNSRFYTPEIGNIYGNGTSPLTET